MEWRGCIIFCMKELVLLRHGESQWNAEGRFTGWVDVPLSERGRHEAELAGRRLLEGGFVCGAACVSVLQRAIHTLNIVLGVMGRTWVPVHKDWRLNEKHYGVLQGRQKREVVLEMGEELVQRWRRAYDCPPPPLPESEAVLQFHDPRYAGISPQLLPLTESLCDAHRRVRHGFFHLHR